MCRFPNDCWTQSCPNFEINSDVTCICHELGVECDKGSAAYVNIPCPLTKEE